MVRNADYWLKKAEEVRTIGESMRDEQARGVMFDLVAQYERMAKRARVVESGGGGNDQSQEG
jgi:hypothetical protein